MKKIILAAMTLCVLGGTVAEARHYHRHKVCYWRHHHRICRWR